MRRMEERMHRRQKHYLLRIGGVINYTYYEDTEMEQQQTLMETIEKKAVR